MKKFVIVYATDVPKKLPPDAKLKIEDHSVDKKELYVGWFSFNEGTLNEGLRKVRDGHFNCEVLSSEDQLIKEMDRRKKVYSKSDYKKVHPVVVRGVLKPILVDLAIKEVLTQIYKFKGFNDKSIPFFYASLYKKNS